VAASPQPNACSGIALMGIRLTLREAHGRTLGRGREP
jgi:hypothetical protein